jgi:hypothetical protein
MLECALVAIIIDMENYCCVFPEIINGAITRGLMESHDTRNSLAFNSCVQSLLQRNFTQKN